MEHSRYFRPNGGRPSYGRPQRFNNRFRRPSRFGRRQPPTGSIHSYIQKATSISQQVVEEIQPTTRFSQLSLSPVLKKNIASRGYDYLTPIQKKSMPAILQGKDVTGIANTGTGKTAAFLIPIIENIIKNPSYKVLIIAPTRELAIQIRDELRLFTNRQIAVYSTVCIGQSSMWNQISELRRNPHLVIGTPGRLKDLIERKVLKLEQFKMIVLDEVDRMLDMGFVHDVKHIISFLPKERRSLFFSATITPEINRLIQTFVIDPVTISVKTKETTSHIHQDVVRPINGETKIETLRRLLTNQEFRKVLVFGRTKMGVERLSRDLYQKGFRVTSIHGDKPQFKRQQAIRMFKEDVVKILVATDVAARGLDIHNVTHVINYDIPATYEDYIHRIGRTGRAGNQGMALTLVEG